MLALELSTGRRSVEIEAGQCSIFLRLSKRFLGINASHLNLDGRTWVIWDLINIAWLLNPDWVPSQLVRAPILSADLYWKHDPGRHLLREAYGVDRDAIYRDFFDKLHKAP